MNLHPKVAAGAVAGAITTIAMWAVAAGSSEGLIPSGFYLFGAQPIAASSSNDELMFDLRQLLTKVRA